METDTVCRVAEELAQLALQRKGLVERGHAIPEDELLTARAIRDAEWRGVREHVRGTSPLPDPAAAADRVDQLLSQADSLADRRFASAEGSGQLALLEQQAAELTLRHQQAFDRGRAAEVTLTGALAAWRDHLQVARLPLFEPVPLRA